MATITEDYVSFETAKLLKEKGFEEETYGNYYLGGKFDGKFEESSKVNWNKFFKTPIAAPTQQMAMKWLREVHNVFISIIYENDGVFVDNLKVPLKGVDCIIDNKHNCWFTYEQACEAAIKYCLENLI